MNLNPQSRLKIIKSIEKLKRFSKYMGEQDAFNNFQL